MLIGHKKEQNNAIRSNMDGPGYFHTKWNKSDRERQILYVTTYMWNLKNKTNESIQQNREAHRVTPEWRNLR